MLKLPLFWGTLRVLLVGIWTVLLETASLSMPATCQKLAFPADVHAQPPLEATPGVTALSGWVLSPDGGAVANVKIELGGRVTSTDQAGRFLLEDLLPGMQMLMVDGRTANTPGHSYGQFMFQTMLEQVGTTNKLPFTIWMPILDTEHAIEIPVPTTKEIVATTPRIPGLEVHIPAGIRIRDMDGNLVHSITITPLSTEKPPFPLPAGVSFPTFFTLQPDGAMVEGTGQAVVPGLQLIFPNRSAWAPGTQIPYWTMDSKTGAWVIYGKGIVTDDQQKIIPTPDTQLFMLSCSPAGNPPGAAPLTYPTPGNETSDGEPVDLGTGLYVSRVTDFYIPDTIPIQFSRVYRPGDTATPARSFGLSTTHSYNMFLVTNSDSSVDLILDDGGRIHYPGSPGMHTATPTAFYGSTLSAGISFSNFVGDGTTITLRNGTQLYFQLYGAPNVSQTDPNPAYHQFLTAIKDRYGNTLTIDRSWQNDQDVTQITSPNGRYIQFTYDSSHRITKITDNIGRNTFYGYDTNGRLVSVTDANGGVTTYGYSKSPTDELLTIKNPRGITALTNTYDSSERVIKQTLGDGSVYQFGYVIDASGHITQTTVTNPVGSVRQVSFDSRGYTTSDTSAFGKPEVQTTTYSRQSTGELVSQVTDQLGRNTAFNYDLLGNLTSITQLAGTQSAITSSFTYESIYNQLTSITDPMNHTIYIGRDSMGNASYITDQNQNTASFTYNSSGQRLTETDPLNNTVRYTYNNGDLVQIQDPLGNTAARYADGVGRTLSVSDPLGNTIAYTYDNLNQIVSFADQLGAVSSFSYDANGNLLTFTDARNGVTSYSYDNSDRLLTRKDPLAHSESYAYDANGNMVQHIDRKGQTSIFTYDGLNRMQSAGFGKVVQGKTTTYQNTVGYTFDGGNRLTRAVDSVAGTVSNSYDGLDRLINQMTAVGAVSYTYDNAGRRTSMTVAGQTQMSYSFDPGNRITQLTQGTTSIGFSYDSANRRTVLTLPDGLSYSYSYDNASRLTGISYMSGGSAIGSLNYQYDAAGRRIGVSGTLATTSAPASVPSATYNAANQLTNWNGLPSTYDANGNLISDGVHNYSWNARDELTSIDSGGAATFAYDAYGRRTTKTLGGSSSVSVVYDGLNPVQEISGGLPTANLLAGGVDEYFVRTDATGQSIFLSDASGSTIALADQTGTIRTQYTYDPFGITTQSGASTANTLSYTGREYDTAGLYFYRSRYYNPQAGRFISEDPIGFAGSGANLYAYVYDSPANLKDALGLYAGMDDLVFTLGGAAAGLLSTAVGDVLSGGTSSLGTYAANAIGGAVGGEALLYFGPISAGAATGFVSNLAQQYFNYLANPNCGFKPGQLLASTAIGAGTGLIPGMERSGLTMGRNSMNAIYKQMRTKFENGTISNVSFSTSIKMFAGRAADTNLPASAVFGGLFNSAANSSRTAGRSCECH